MSAELGVALAKPRCQTEQDEICSKWSELSTLDTDLTLFRPVYAPKDFLDILAQVKSPNLSSEQVMAGGGGGGIGVDGTVSQQQQGMATLLRPSWGMISVPLRVRKSTKFYVWSSI